MTPWQWFCICMFVAILATILVSVHHVSDLIEANTELLLKRSVLCPR